MYNNTCIAYNYNKLRNYSTTYVRKQYIIFWLLQKQLPIVTHCQGTIIDKNQASIENI